MASARSFQTRSCSKLSLDERYIMVVKEKDGKRRVLRNTRRISTSIVEPISCSTILLIEVSMCRQHLTFEGVTFPPETCKDALDRDERIADERVEGEQLYRSQIVQDRYQ